MDERHRSGIGPVQVGIIAAACGLAAANIYYSQHLIGLIAPALGLHPGLAGLIVALTQLGPTY
jgi:membrane associated rhomboid family serine protease